MTRYTKLERKRHVEASESFSVTPLMPAKSVSSKAAPSPAAQPSSAPDKPPKEKAKSRAKEAGHKSEGPQEAQADGENKKRKAEEGGEDKPSKKAKGGKGKKKEEAKPKTEQGEHVCFVCRKTGHNAKDCKQAEGIGMCYSCGSMEHTTATCKKLNKDGNKFKFATCFVCKGQGHLASACPKNEKGLYPQGGSCRFCEAGVMALGKIDLVQGADDDDYHIFVEEKRKMTEETRVVKKLVKEGPKKVKKVVSF
ncbi:hypothetical protein DFQ26_007086 [Actinomortierella ambigua]|nr:hypothetical protein DFQ26_007086 [Actinomortierella ambigua]